MTPPAGATRRPIGANHVHSLSGKTPKDNQTPHEPELHLVRTGRDRYEFQSSGATRAKHLSLPMARYTTGFRSENEKQRRSLAANPRQLSIFRGITALKTKPTPPAAVARAPKPPVVPQRVVVAKSTVATAQAPKPALVRRSATAPVKVSQPRTAVRTTHVGETTIAAPAPAKDDDIQKSRVNREVMRSVRRLLTARYSGAIPSHGTISVKYRVRTDGSIDLPKESHNGRTVYRTVQVDRSLLSGLTGDEQKKVYAEIHSQIERILNSQKFQPSGSRDPAQLVPINIVI